MRSIKTTDERECPIVYFDIELDDMGLTVYEYRVYGRMARRASGGQGVCTETLVSMAAGCQMSRRTLVIAINGLIKRKMISRKSKLGSTSTYHLINKTNWRKLESREVVQEMPTPSAGDAQGVVQEMPTRGAGDAHGVVQEMPTKYTHKKTNKEMSDDTGEVEDIGDVIDELYPGLFNQWQKQRNMRDLIHRLNVPSGSLRNFPAWLKRTHPFKSNTYFSFMDHLLEFSQSLISEKRKATCSNCTDGYLMNEAGMAVKCTCQI